MDQRYELYKDSGVQWLGEIPSHWKLVRIKALLEERTEKSKTGTEEPLSMSQKFGIIPTKEMDVVPNAASSYIGAKNVYVGDIVFNKLKAHLGVFAISQYEGLVSPDYAVYYSKGISDKRYIEYQFHTPLYIQEFKRHATGIAIGLTRLYTNQLYAIQSICPPLEEQKAIVLYLDDKCKKIDEWVNKKEKEVEHLQELKQRVVANAVTLGFNPNVTMKQTNITWLPKVPEHWECVKLKMFCQDNKEKNKGNIESCVLSLSYGNVIVKKNINFGLVPENYDNYQIVNPGYIILRLTDLQNDHKSLRTGLVKNRGIITSAYVGLIVKNMNCEYAQLILHSYDVMKVFYGMGGGLRQSMSYNDISNIYIPVPPLEEQKQIVDYITDKTSKIDKLIANINKEIEGIKEYKQRLISDVVTGQIKVINNN